MSLTLLAILILPIAFKMVLDPSGMRRVLKDWDDSMGLQFFSGIMTLMLALLVFISSEMSFSWDWESLLSWMGVLIGIKGVACLIPSVTKWKVRMLTETRMPIAGFAAMLVALALVYIDTQVL
ncbi:MAG: hypothetical protein AAB383_01590 [Patescibacteria group bacterium]